MAEDTLLYEKLERSLKNEELVALSTVIAGQQVGNKMLIWPDGTRLGDLQSQPLNEQTALRAGELLNRQKSERCRFESDGLQSEVFIEVFPPPPKLIIVGAVHAAIPLITFAKILGFRTIVGWPSLPAVTLWDR